MNEAREVIANLLSNFLQGWKENVDAMEKGIFNAGEEVPPTPGTVSYQALFDETQKIIEELRSTTLSLSQPEITTLQVALTSYMIDLKNGALGDDPNGIEIAELYKRHIHSIQRRLTNPLPEPKKMVFLPVVDDSGHPTGQTYPVDAKTYEKFIGEARKHAMETGEPVEDLKDSYDIALKIGESVMISKNVEDSDG